MRLRFSQRLSVWLGVATLLFATSFAAAQASKSGGPSGPDKFEVYAGYGYWHPFASDINYYNYEPIYNLNVASSLSYFFKPHFGVEVEGNYFSDNRTKDGALTGNCGYTADLKLHCEEDQTVNTLVAGPVYRWQFGRWVPYVHAMGGALRMNGPVANPQETGWDIVGGVGTTYIFPFLHGLIGARVQLDGHYGRVDYGPLVEPAGITGGIAKPTVAHASAGLVFRIGGGEEVDKEELMCSADPGTVYPGDVVHLSAVTRGMGTHTYFSWTAPGLKDNGGGASAFDLPTGNLGPGTYPVEVRAMSSSHGRVQKTCMTNFQIHAWDPPTIACKAQPDTVDPGTAVNIVSDARSPQNRALVYSYATSAGAITGTGPTVSLATDTVPAGTVTVTCDVTDDLGQKAQSTATVTINQPAPVAVSPAAMQPPAMPAVVSQEPLCTISFERDKKRPTRVDNEAKACLDSVALSMGRDAQNRLVIVGSYVDRETMNTAAERALHAKQYLVEAKGIDPNAIDTMIKQSTEKTAESVLLPPGATFDEQGTVGFDPTSVHNTGEAYGRPRTR